jgi:hypothetical protein
MAQLIQSAANITQVGYPFYNTVWQQLKIPDYYNTAVKRYGTESVIGLMDMFGTRTFRRDLTYSHVEDDHLMPIITVSNATAAGAGQPITVTILSGYTNSGLNVPVEVGYEPFFGDGNETWGYISAINTATPYNFTITIQPHSSATTLSTSNGQTIIFSPVNNVPAGSCPQPGEVNTPGITYTNTMTTARKDLSVTGEMMALWNAGMKLVYGIDLRTGAMTPCWYNEILGQYEVKFNNAREYKLVGGQTITNTTLTNAGLSDFNGLIPSIKAGGNVENYSAAFGFKISNLQDMTLRMDKEQCPPEFFVKAGSNLTTNITNEVKAYFPNGAIQYDAFHTAMDEEGYTSEDFVGKTDMSKEGFTAEEFRQSKFGRMDSQHRAIEWGFTSVGYNNYSLHIGKLGMFINPSQWGAPGYPYPYNGLCIPAGRTPDRNQETLGAPSSYIQITHLSGCGYDRLYHHLVGGGASWLPEEMRTDNCDDVIFSYIEQYGMEVFCNNKFFYIQGNS